MFCKGLVDRIQAIRGIAIIMVVITHTVLWNPYELYIRPFVNPAVGIFVFLSGLLTSLEIDCKSIRHFYGRRFIRVFIPYIIWSLVYIVFTGDYANALINFLTGNCCSIFYYIFVYMQLVLVTPILVMIKNTKINWIGYIVTPVAIMIEYLLTFNGITISYPYNINNLFVWIIYYYLGLNLRDKASDPKNYGVRRNILLSILIVISFALEIVEALAWKAYGRVDISTSQIKISTMISAILICLLIYGIIISGANYKKKKGYVEKIIVYIGNCSFGIYLIHQLVILSLGKYFGEYKLDNCFWFIIEALVVIIISVGIVSLGQKVFGKKIGKYLGFY